MHEPQNGAAAGRLTTPDGANLRAALTRFARSRFRPQRAAELSPQEVDELLTDWLGCWSRADQVPELLPWSWHSWLLLGGRGAGKTRAGAEWVRAVALGLWPGVGAPAGRIALVGPTLDEVRSVMVEGVSGLMAVHRDCERPVYVSSQRRLTWPNGAVAQIYSAEDPESLRGPQFDAAWCDELAKWNHAEATWDMLQFGLRLGDAPRQVVTTTPRPVPLLKRLLADPATLVSRASTFDNGRFLAARFLREVQMRYGGTRLGRQELMAELIADDPEALFRRDGIEAARVRAAPELQRIVVAVDPPAGHGPRANACGIVAAGLGADGRIYVLDDHSVKGLRPAQWAGRVVGLYHARGADRVVAEVNQGGAMVEQVLREVDASVAYRAVHATRGKRLRAEPVAALYEQGRVSHVGGVSGAGG